MEYLQVHSWATQLFGWTHPFQFQQQLAGSKQQQHNNKTRRQRPFLLRKNQSINRLISDSLFLPADVTTVNCVEVAPARRKRASLPRVVLALALLRKFSNNRFGVCVLHAFAVAPSLPQSIFHLFWTYDDLLQHRGGRGSGDGT